MRTSFPVALVIALAGMMAGASSADAAPITLKASHSAGGLGSVQTLMGSLGETPTLQSNQLSLFSFNANSNISYSEILLFWQGKLQVPLTRITISDLNQVLTLARTVCSLPGRLRPTWCKNIGGLVSFIEALKQKLANGGGGGGGNPSPVAAPEPGTLLLMGSGVATLVALRRRRQAKAVQLIR
jgi:PEP-CTERM motif